MPPNPKPEPPAGAADDAEVPAVETEAERNLRLLQDRFGPPQPRDPLPEQPALWPDDPPTPPPPPASGEDSAQEEPR